MFFGIVVGILIAVTIAYFATEARFSFSLSDRDCEHARQQYYDARDTARKNQRKYTGDERDHANACAQTRMADAAEWGFYILVTTLVFTAFAVVAAWKTLQLSRKTSTAQLRAYVFARPTNITLNAGLLESVTLAIRNNGATPAASIGMRGGVAIRPWPLPDGEKLDFPEVRETTQNLAPQAEYPAEIKVGQPITQDAANKLAAGTHRLYALATISYRDVFGDLHTTKLCSGMDGPTFIAALTRSTTGAPGTVQHDTAWNFSHRYNDWT